MRLHTSPLFLALIVATCFSQPIAWGQFGGSRAGVESAPSGVASLPLLEPKVAESYIAIDGRAEIRVKPTEIRMVLAITSERETADECQQAIAAAIVKVKTAWAEIEIKEQHVVADFIAVLPRYEWNLEKRGEGEAAVEKRAGYRMQTNLHLAVVSDAQAERALTRAFEQGITDIIAFDYWSKDLDAVKVQARQQAVAAAKKKADELLDALFDERPRAINVQEQTTVHYPEALYQSFDNAQEEQFIASNRGTLPVIAAHRPKNTYYRGLYSNGDVQSRELPMKPEISVVSSVRLYYESPAATQKKKKDQP